MSEAAKKLIKSFEGCRLTAYRCPAGVWTIGYGRTTNVKQGDTCTQAQADKWFDEEYERFEKQVRAFVKVLVNDNQIGALTSFAYNVGTGALKGSTLLKKLNKKDYTGAANEFVKWNKANGKELAGLTKRRLAEKELFLKSSATTVAEAVMAGKQSIPYKVKTTCELNIRTAAGTNYPVIRVAKKGEILTVWAVCSNGGIQWGKNGKEFYCLKYCEVV